MPTSISKSSGCVRPPENAAKQDESAAKPDPIGETILETGTTRDSAAAVIVDEVTPQTAVHENGNGAVAEITPDEEAAVLATVAAVLAKIEPRPAGADDSANQARSIQEDDDTAAAKRAIIHEWENWSALHSDELRDPNVADYFFRHLQAKKPYLVKCGFEYDAVCRYIAGK